MIGQTLGHYRIIEQIGAGGMGVVYRARDERLGRDVALKVLPEVFARDADRMARFEREAKLLASLNHPNIAAIYGLEESAGVRAIAMELVEGPSLSDLLRKGPLSPQEALSIAKQTAEALEAAHEKGIIHRDLKPANVKLTPEGNPKVLDFGLAKALVENSAVTDLSASPTISEIVSKTGVILGTAAYMSPEQARGKPLDKRTDIWSFGCLLFEMLTGKISFRGDTVSDTIAHILQREPDWSALPKETPPSVHRVLRHCLQKVPQRRLRDIGDAIVELEEVLAGPVSGSLEALTSVAHPKVEWWMRMHLWMAAAALMMLVTAVALWWGLRGNRIGQQPVSQLQMSAPSLSINSDGTIDISRDGSFLVYVGEHDGKPQLFLRRLDSLEAKPIAGTENAASPFISPGGEWIGFWADQKMKKVLASGGPAQVLYELNQLGPTTPLKSKWEAGDKILFAGVETRGVLKQIQVGGGEQAKLADADLRGGWFYLYQPELLPGGDVILFTMAKPGGRGDAMSRVVVQSIKTGQRKRLIEGAFAAHYVPTGHLVYVQAGTLMAVPFDLKRLELAGTPVPLIEGISMWSEPRGADYAVSENGTLAYLAQAAANSDNTLVWVDRRGKETPIVDIRRVFTGAQLSPDGRKLATWLPDDRQVWVLDIESGRLSRVTTEGENFWNIWSLDSRRIVFNSLRSGSPGTSLFWQAADGSGRAERLTTTDHLQQPRSFSPDGSMLVFQDQGPPDTGTGYDIWVLPMAKGAKPRPLLQTPFNEFQPKLSPDGRWLAYVSNESGRDEIYVRPFPAMDAKWQVSTEGGHEPAWAPNGRELFYRTGQSARGSKLMAVTITTSPEFRADKPSLLFEGPYIWATLYGQSYDVSRDGNRFVMVKYDPPKSPKEINIVLNWFEELKRRVPTDKK